jgi:hypothetical protein
MKLVCGIVTVVLTSATLLYAQELKYIDLSDVSQRTELRYPPAPPPDCKEDGTCVAGGSGGGSVSDGAPDRRDPHALGAYLERITPSDINPTQPFEAEFKVLNTGLAPINIPVSPHLSDFQDSDSAPFEYFSINLVVHADTLDENKRGGVLAMAYIELYGSTDHQETMLVLKPGEWIRVKAKMKLRKFPLEPIDARCRGEFWLRKNIFRPHPGGFWTEVHNLYPNQTPTPWTIVHLLRPLK